MSDRTATTLLTLAGSLFGHYGGDYLAQDDHVAGPTEPGGPPLKQQHTPRGRRALALHTSTYTAAQAATKALLYRTAGVRVPVLAQLAGAITEGVLHAVIDDGRTLRAFSRIPGCQRDEHGRRIGRQERFHDVVPGGRAHMDQAAHLQVQIPAGAIATVVVAAFLARRGR